LRNNQLTYSIRITNQRVLIVFVRGIVSANPAILGISTASALQLNENVLCVCLVLRLLECPIVNTKKQTMKLPRDYSQVQAHLRERVLQIITHPQ
jgi:hypothetical protein